MMVGKESRHCERGVGRVPGTSTRRLLEWVGCLSCRWYSVSLSCYKASLSIFTSHPYIRIQALYNSILLDQNNIIKWNTVPRIYIRKTDITAFTFLANYHTTSFNTREITSILHSSFPNVTKPPFSHTHPLNAGPADLKPLPPPTHYVVLYPIRKHESRTFSSLLQQAVDVSPLAVHRSIRIPVNQPTPFVQGLSNKGYDAPPQHYD